MNMLWERRSSNTLIPFVKCELSGSVCNYWTRMWAAFTAERDNGAQHRQLIKIKCDRGRKRGRVCKYRQRCQCDVKTLDDRAAWSAWTTMKSGDCIRSSQLSCLPLDLFAVLMYYGVFNLHWKVRISCFMLVFKFAVCCGVKRPQIVLNCW